MQYVREEISKMIADGRSKKEISDLLGIGYSTVKKHSHGIRSIKPRKEYKCVDCGEAEPSNFYGKMRNRCKACHNQLGYKAQREKIFEYAESRGPIECSRCGYDRSFAALEWHHRDPSEKDPSWNRGWNYNRLKQELDKCDLVCANCHREIHYGSGGLTPTRTGT